jgi:hypothetical protein
MPSKRSRQTMLPRISIEFVSRTALVALVALSLALATGCGNTAQSEATTTESAAAEVSQSRPSQAVVEATPNETSAANDVADSATGANTEAASKTVAADVAKSTARGSLREITFDTLKFEIEKGQPFQRWMLTKAIENLNGQRVRIRGYMLPSFQQSGITQFVLVRDNMECCFGPGAALYDCLIVEMAEGKGCNFSVRPIAVEGTFQIHEFKGPDDTHLAVFHLDGEQVR